MKKVSIILFILVIIMISGCSKSNNDAEIKIKNQLAVKEQKPSDLENAAKAQDLEVKDILINNDFYGGNVGEIEFHGGKVLLWRVEPNRLRVRCSLNMGNDIWRSTNVTSDIATNNESPLIATEAMLNDGDEKERKVPLWTFYGIVNDEKIQRIRVNFIGFPSIETTVENGAWMVIYQGAIDESNSIKYEAMDDAYHVLYTEEHHLH